MASSKPSKRALLRQILEQNRPPTVDEALAETIRAQLAPVSDSYFRELLIDSGVPLSPEVEGVRQGTMDDLERTLNAALERYEVAADAATRQQVRNSVIQARDRARMAARSSKLAEEKRTVKQEMLLWLQTWLENPPLFRGWLRLRKRQLQG